LVHGEETTFNKLHDVTRILLGVFIWAKIWSPNSSCFSIKLCLSYNVNLFYFFLYSTSLEQFLPGVSLGPFGEIFKYSACKCPLVNYTYLVCVNLLKIHVPGLLLPFWLYSWPLERLCRFLRAFLWLLGSVLKDLKCHPVVTLYSLCVPFFVSKQPPVIHN
jgi:hypothetical protein